MGFFEFLFSSDKHSTEQEDVVEHVNVEHVDEVQNSVKDEINEDIEKEETLRLLSLIEIDTIIEDDSDDYE